MEASVDAVMATLQDRVRERVRADLVRHGASGALEDPALFAEIDSMLRAAIDRSQPAALLLPELLGDPPPGASTPPSGTSPIAARPPGRSCSSSGG